MAGIPVRDGQPIGEEAVIAGVDTLGQRTSGTPPRIVYVAPQPPYPLTSGMVIRQFHLLRSYAGWAKTDLVFFYANGAELEAGMSLRPYCESIHPVPVSTTRRQTVFASLPRWRRAMGTIFTPNPRVITLEYSAEMRRVVERVLPTADVVHIARLHMAPYVAGVRARGAHRPAVVLDLDDVETSIRARSLNVEAIPFSRRIFAYYDLVRLCAYQARTLRACDRVFVCSARDRDRLGRANVSVIPNGTTIPAEAPKSETDGRTLLFCGLLSWPPNVDGLDFFVNAVFPLVRREMPEVKLLVVGRTPGPAVRKLHNGTTVIVAPDVPSVEDYYRRATAAVVPLRMGGGTRLKILEAWALGVPVVSTSVGCEGLDAVDGRHLLVADDPARFARRCLELLRAPELRARLTEHAREFVAKTYSWDAVASQLRAAVRPLVEQRAAAVSRGR